MAKSFEDIGRIGIICAHCGHEFREEIGRLRDEEDMPCPSCGGIIDLNSDDIRSRIHRAHKLLANITGKSRIKRH